MTSMAGAVTLVAILVTGTLVILTSSLHTTSMILADSVESVRLAEEAEVDLLRHDHNSGDAAQRVTASELHARLHEARGYARTGTERQLLLQVNATVQAYLTAAAAGEAEAAARLKLDAVDALERFVDATVERSRGARAEAARTDQWAKILVLSTAVLTVSVAGYLLWWLRQKAFRPVLALAGAMERFGKGEGSARAEESGPEELRDMVRRFNQMASSLAAQREAQMAFLAGVAHDLRTPLTALRLSLYRLDPSQPLPPEAQIRKTLEMVKRQLTRIERMTDDFLDIVKIEAGKLDLRVHCQDVRVLVAEIVALFESTSEHELRVTLPDGPVLVHCDSDRIGQVLSNLLSNAIKYSPTHLAVEVSMADGADGVLITVRDHGIGMTLADQRRLFEPFRRVGVPDATIPGIGLGLFTASRIVEAHKGRIEVASAPGQGSCFTIRLPHHARAAA
jgi:two-component system sensor histidine kinase MtrB